MGAATRIWTRPPFNVIQNNKRLNILCITMDFPPNPGGIAFFLHNLLLQLHRMGHRLDVLAPRQEGCEAMDATQPYRIYRYNHGCRFSSLPSIWLTLALHFRNRYDVVFVGHFFTTHALGVILLNRLAGLPYVILSHGNDLSYGISTRIDKLVTRWLLGNAALALGNSRFTAGRIRKAGCHGSVKVLNPGVDITRFHPGADAASVRQQYGLEGHRVLLTTARLVARKNVDGVLRALPRVIKKAADVLYLIAGDGEKRDQWEALCDDLGLKTYVRFLGHVKDDLLPSLYCASDAFVLPSLELDEHRDYEGFGIVFVEANACGKPVIGGRVGGTADAIIDGETGLLVDPQNIDEIAEAIIHLLTDRELARRLGENGWRRVRQEFSWEKIGQKLGYYLKSVAR